MIFPEMLQLGIWDCVLLAPNHIIDNAQGNRRDSNGKEPKFPRQL